MATLTSSYQYIGRSNGISCSSGYKYYILLYAKTVPDKDAGKYTVSVLMRLACDSSSTFYGFRTTGSVTVAGSTAISWSNTSNPNSAWKDSSSITVGGVTYKKWVNLGEGSVVVNTGFGVAKDITIASSWVVNESYSASWYPYTNKYATASITATLPMIAGASAITSATNVTLGNACSVKWTPLASTFYYKIKYVFGDESYTTGAIAPKTTSAYTYQGFAPPIEWASQIPANSSGVLGVRLYTYTDSACTKQVGDMSFVNVTATVPNNSDTQPTVTMNLAPVSSLGSEFNGLYIKGKTKVKASLSAKGKYDATIKSFKVNVGGKDYDSGDGYTSDYLSQYGTVKVTASATDSRGYAGSASQNITVIDYATPMLLPVSGESNVVAARCDSEGVLSDSGTSLLIKAKRSYSPVKADGVQKNFCQIRYRYKPEGGSYNDWQTILAGDSLGSDEVSTGVISGVTLLASSAYVVQVSVIDTVGESHITSVNIPSDEVFAHRTKDAMGLGKYVQGSKLLDIGWKTRHYGGVMPMELADGTNLNDLKDQNVYTVYYSTVESLINCPVTDVTFMLEVFQLGWRGQVMQRLTECSENGTVYTRQLYSDAWTEWECENPPMKLGVEYRTTERFNGKAVYTKLIDCGTLPSAAGNMRVAHGANATQVIRCVGQMSDSNSLPFYYTASNYVSIYAGNTYVVIYVSNDKSSATATAQIWYTKD